MEWKSDTSWKRCNIAGELPPERWGHADAVIGDRIYVFGGYHGERLNDVFYLDTDAFPSLSWQALTTKGESPVGRSYHTASAVDSSIWIFGGNDGEKRLSDLWVLNTETLLWKSVTPVGPTPIERSGHSATVVDDTIWIFGGVRSEAKEHLNDVWMLNTTTGKWKPVRPSGTPPQARSGHAATCLGNSIYIFGGYNGEGRLNDLWKLDTIKLKWSQPGVRGTKPKKRKSHTCCTVGEDIIVFGGYGGSDRLNDIWQFSTVLNEWNIICTDRDQEIPAGRSAHTASAVGTNVYIFGGYNGARLNDVWCLSLGECVDSGFSERYLIAQKISSLKRKLGHANRQVHRLQKQNRILLKENVKLKQGGTNTSLSTSTDESLISRWLSGLKLEHYFDAFMEEGFDDLNVIMEISEIDLEHLGIKKSGHRKKLMLAIKELKEKPRLRHTLTPIFNGMEHDWLEGLCRKFANNKMIQLEDAQKISNSVLEHAFNDAKENLSKTSGTDTEMKFFSDGSFPSYLLFGIIEEGFISNESLGPLGKGLYFHDHVAEDQELTSIKILLCEVLPGKVHEPERPMNCGPGSQIGEEYHSAKWQNKTVLYHTGLALPRFLVTFSIK